MNNDLVMTPTFLERLRNATGASHTALEELAISKSIMDPQVTNRQYALYLKLMHAVVADAEQNIFPQLAAIINDLGIRNKTHLIEKDLAYLGERTTGLKPLTENGIGFSLPFALGIMYVVEGSSLGGRVILKNINTALGHDGENGAAYFSGYGPTTGSIWKAFINMMSEYEEKNKDADEIIEGANFAFDSISRHFTENAPK